MFRFLFLQEDGQRNVMAKEKEKKEMETRILKNSRSVGASKDLYPSDSLSNAVDLIC